MSSRAFFCADLPGRAQEFTKFSKKCLERWKTMSAKEESQLEDMAKSDKAYYDSEMKNYIPPKGDKKGKEKKIPMFLKGLRLLLYCFVLNIIQRSKVNTTLYPLETLQNKWHVLWSEQSAKDKEPYDQKAAKLKEKYEKEIAAFCAKGKSEAGKKGPGRPTGSKKNEPEDEGEEEEEDEDEDEEEEDEEYVAIL